MEVVSNIVIPIVKFIVYSGIVGWVLYLIYWVIKTFCPNLRWQIKYGLLRKKFKIEDVEWCIDAIEKGKSAIDIKKFLLLKGQSKVKINEIIFICNQIQKTLKGGNKDVRQFKQDNGENKQIQKIS